MDIKQKLNVQSNSHEFKVHYFLLAHPHDDLPTVLFPYTKYGNETDILGHVTNACDTYLYELEIPLKGSDNFMRRRFVQRALLVRPVLWQTLNTPHSPGLTSSLGAAVLDFVSETEYGRRTFAFIICSMHFC